MREVFPFATCDLRFDFERRARVNRQLQIKNGFGRAVSRILSSLLRVERTICLSSRYPEPVPRWRDRSGPLRGSLFGLAPDGVFRAASLALRAVRSCRTFSPLPQSYELRRSVFCGTVRRKVSRLSARVYPNRTGLSYAASRPLVFGLSSQPFLKFTHNGFPETARFPSAYAKSMNFKKGWAVLRPSKTVEIIADGRKISRAEFRYRPRVLRVRIDIWHLK